MEKNKLQENFDDVEKFCSIQRNVINKKKTKTVSFNTATNKDFTPRISNSDGTQYDKKSALLIAENCNAFFGPPHHPFTLTCYFRCHRAGSQLKMHTKIIIAACKC